MKEQIERLKTIIREDATTKNYLLTNGGAMCVIGGILSRLGCHVNLNQKVPSMQHYAVLHVAFPLLKENIQNCAETVYRYTTDKEQFDGAFEKSKGTVMDALVIINDSQDALENRRNALCNFLDALVEEER